MLADLLHVCHDVIACNMLAIVVFHQFLSRIILGQLNVQPLRFRLELNIFDLVDVDDVRDGVLDVLARRP